MKSIFICLLGILFACPALAGKKAVENHYRAIHQNVPISISVSDDINRDSRVFKSLTARGFPDPVPDVISLLPDTLRNSLIENGIAIADAKAARHLHISVAKLRQEKMVLVNGYPKTLIFGLSGKFTYTPVAGEPVTMDFYYGGGKADEPEGVAIGLSNIVVEQALLTWYPSKKAAKIKPPSGKSNGISLFVTSTTGVKNPVPRDAPVVLAWEAFPSDRILSGGVIDPASISDVKYELKYYPYRGSAAPGMAVRDHKMRLHTLTAQSFELPGPLPWCGEITWTVRARFTLDGHPRVTQWTLGFITRVGTPEGFDCFRGFMNPIGAAAAWAAPKPTQIEPLMSGEGVASIVLTGSRCGVDESRCSADVYRESNRSLQGQLQKALDKVGNAIDVRNGEDFVDPAWFGTEKRAFQIDRGEFYEWLTDEQNKANLKASGVRRILAIHSGEKEQIVGSSSASDLGGVIGDSEVTTRSSLTVFADVIDVETGNRLVQLEVAAQGSKTDGTVWLLVVPISYKSGNDAFEEGVELIASVAAHTLMGAQIGWPESFRKEVQSGPGN